MIPARTALIVLAIALPLAGCGKLGDLERPGPLTGVGSAASRATDGQDRPSGPTASRPVENVDPRDRAADPAAAGARSNPSAQPQ
jgi:hypothetical protein